MTKARKDKTIVRVVKRENPFVQIDKTPINDERLSWKAKGLLVYLISKPDDWTIMIDDLIKHAKDGRDSVKAGLRELEAAGYLSRKQARYDDGTFGPMEFVVYETPQIVDTTVFEPQTENPSTDNSTANGKSVDGKSVNGKTVNGKSATTNNDSTKNHFTNNDLTNIFDDEEREEGGYAPSSPSPFYQENKTLIEQFVDYAMMRGIHQDFVRDIAERLTKVNYRLSHYSLGTAVNKTLDGIEAATISHVPNYFMTVLESEVKKEHSSITKRRSE